MSGASEWERELHDRLLRSDPVAPSELAERLYDTVLSEVGKAFPKETDRDILADAASEALINYLKQPEQYDPDQLGLKSYLAMAAKADYRNLAEKRRRLRVHEIPTSDVEVHESARNNDLQASQEGREPSPDLRLLREESEAEYEQFLTATFPNPLDRKLANMVLEKERSTAKFAQVLGITDQPHDEQKRAVKRNKDRIKKRLDRLGEDTGE